LAPMPTTPLKHVPIRIACDNRYAMGLRNLTSESDNYRKEEDMS
jgi:hypothetical protein